MSAIVPLDNPPPLNPVPNFPYTARPFPVDWLLQYTSLGQMPDPPQPSPNAPRQDSLESF